MTKSRSGPCSPSASRRSSGSSPNWTTTRIPRGRPGAGSPQAPSSRRYPGTAGGSAGDPPPCRKYGASRPEWQPQVAKRPGNLRGQVPTRVGRAIANRTTHPRTVTSVHDQAARGRWRKVVTTTMVAAPSVPSRATARPAVAPPPRAQMVTAQATSRTTPIRRSVRSPSRCGRPTMPDRASSSRSARVLTKWAPTPSRAVAAITAGRGHGWAGSPSVTKAGSRPNDTA